MNTENPQFIVSDILDKISLDLRILRDMVVAVVAELSEPVPAKEFDLDRLNYILSIGIAAEEIANRIRDDFNKRQHPELLGLIEARRAP